MPWRMLAGPLYNVVAGLVDSSRDPVWPKVGSVLYCDLLFGYMEHSGIYIGNNKIVHLAGNGKIETVSPKGFMQGGSGCNIYVSCRDKFSVGSEAAARRAKKSIGSSRNYNFLLDNCHQFSTGCLTGNFNNSSSFLWMLKDESAKELESDNWRYWKIEN